jgi:DUF917 family protein
MVDTVAEAVIAEVGGSESARVLFKGKIVGVERVLRMGHAYGEVIIDSTAGESGQAKERMIIPFKNENIYAKKEDESGKGEVCFDLVYRCGKPANILRYLPLYQILSAF